MAESSHTPGPWCWVQRGNKQSKVFELIHPARGWLTVLDFVRLGMQGGTFRLARWEGDRGNMGGLMQIAHEIDLKKHPDACLIAAAPELLEACEGMLNGIERSYTQIEFWKQIVFWKQKMQKAIAKAEGR